MIDTEQRAAAQAFADSWKGKGYEKGESQTFWSTPLEKLLGVILDESATKSVVKQGVNAMKKLVKRRVIIRFNEPVPVRDARG